MAKCVKDKQSGKVIRVSNVVADELVKTGKYAYAPKSDFRQQQKAENEGANA